MTAPISDDAEVRAFLSTIEKVEARLLTWGFVDGGLSRDEVEELAREHIAIAEGEHVLFPQDLVRRAIDYRVLFKIDTGGWPLYRSRMAESVRLFARLRQIMRGRDWRTAPTLVSDFRFVLRTRVYPRRDISVENAREAWKADGVLTDERRRTLDAMFVGRESFGLSGFQVRATSRVLQDLDSGKTRGMIATVGTGSGKTLAFYLPALTHVSSLVAANERWTKALALYPRKELLKDQFAGTFAEARRLDALLQGRGKRKLVIGAFYEDTPYSPDEASVRASGWRKDSGGYLCPFLKCPSCGRAVRWGSTDLREQKEALTCVDLRCGRRITGDEVALTREVMRDRPPDVLFTTTEMLNRRMSDGKFRHVFGVGTARRPQLMLLDEVHTYEGTSGAQVSYLIRRWRHAIAKPVQFTGLSATLQNATEFFSTLIGLPVAAVEEVTPRSGELLAEGMEYLLALRGDPVSKTALLSTSIQTAMLLRRVLDPAGSSPSNGLYGHKVFAFTDDLDATNRLYHDLLSAEGWDRWGRRQANLPLAAARGRSAPASGPRLAAGQSWALAEEIGHEEGLVRSLPIGRTSSQDAGVDAQAEVVVATASLEVGFDDPDVGAIMQHKAPRDPAAFLQRKGRAGRPRSMRPWTVVVLSDYGRDRLAYQGYDSLFNPVLQTRFLPVRNRYVLRIQATYALIEWTALQIPSRASIFEDWAGPVTGQKPWDVPRRNRQELHARLLRRLLEGDSSLLASLQQHLRGALNLDDAELTAVLWEPPRALLTSVIPTVLRRLESQWSRIKLRDGESPHDLAVAHAPLPDFLPQNLFSDLNLPEVTIGYEDDAREGLQEAALGITQTLRTLAPGAVTRRFAIASSSTRHWIAPQNLVDKVQKLSVEEICHTYEELGSFQCLKDGKVEDVRCIRPWAIRPTMPPTAVQSSSKSQLLWQTQIIPSGDGVRIETPQGSAWSNLLDHTTFFIHNYQSHAEVRRFAVGTQATIGLGRGRELNATIHFVDGSESEKPAAVGFVEHVDAIAFRCPLPDDLDSLLSPSRTPTPLMRGLRTAYFRYRVGEDALLKQYANIFKIDWLHQTYLSAVVAWALSTGLSLQDTVAEMRRDKAKEGRALEKVLEAIFQTLEVDDEDEESVGVGDSDGRQKVHNELLELFGHDVIRERLADLATVLWAPTDEDFRGWLRHRYRATLALVLLAGCREINPEAGSDDLLVDLSAGPVAPGAQALDPESIWITETTLGGGGVVDEILRRVAHDPRRFLRLVESALGPSDFELVDSELVRILEALEHDRELANRFKDLRESSEHAAWERNVTALRLALSDRGFTASHAIVSALHARVLRPGSDADTDALLRGLAQRWYDQEKHLGIEIDSRVFAYLESAQTEYDSVLARLNAGQVATREWRFRVITGLLWPRGHLVRGHALGSYHPYHQIPEPDRHLVLAILQSGTIAVPLSNPGWKSDLASALRVGGVANLTAKSTESVELKRALLDLAAQSMELDYLQLFPRVEGIVRDSTGYTVSLYVPEALQ